MRRSSDGEAWSIVEVARQAGVSSRTLRHYDDLGLVRPAFVGANGYRYYGRPELLRLQEVLVLRELGLSLDAVARVLDGSTDRVVALRAHRRALLVERDRLARLADTVARTVAQIEAEQRGEDVVRMGPEELFAGFDPERQEQYEAELVERYGPSAQERIDESWRSIGRMSPADAAKVTADLAQRDAAYAELMGAGVDVADPRVQAVTARHHAWVCQFWTPDAEAFAGLGDLYVEHPDFRARYEAVRPGLAEYVRDAMAVYAVESLT